MNVKAVVRKNIIAVLTLLTNNVVYTMRHGLAKGLKRRGGIDFLPRKNPQTKEEKFLIDLDFRDQTIYDVGAYEGMFTLFFARAVGRNGSVIAFEPNPDNVKTIQQNVALNNFDNVMVRPIALGETSGKASLAFCPGVSREGSIQNDIKEQILNKKGAKTIQVAIDTLDNQIYRNNLRKPDFIKIDVEGLELDVLKGMSRTIEMYKPGFFIEIHGHDMQNKEKNIKNIVEFMTGYDYAMCHIESGNRITLSNSEIAREGHLYCK